MKEEKKVLCGYCKKPIHINDWGGVQKDKGFFHAKCHLDAEKKALNIDDVSKNEVSF